MDDRRLRLFSAQEELQTLELISCFLGEREAQSCSSGWIDGGCIEGRTTIPLENYGVWGSLPFLTFNYLLTRHLSTISLFIQLASESMNMDDRRLRVLIAYGEL